MMFRLSSLRRLRLRDYAAGAVAVAAMLLAVPSASAANHRSSAIDLSAASRPHIANDIQDYPCWKSPSNATCDGITPDPDSYCYKDAYPVKQDTGSKYWNGPGTNWWFTTELWYSPHCKSNWATTDTDNPDLSGANGWMSAKIRRFAGPDGPHQMRQAPFQRLNGYQLGQATSPMIFSPHNLAQACGTNDNRTCGAKL